MTLNDGQLSDALASIYTPPTGDKAEVSRMVFKNTSAVAARAVTVAFKRTTVRELYSFTIPLKGFAVIDDQIGLRRTDEIQASADIANEVNFVVEGTEIAE